MNIINFRGEGWWLARQLKFIFMYFVIIFNFIVLILTIHFITIIFICNQYQIMVM